MAFALITHSVRSTYTHKPRFYRNILASLHFKARDTSLSLSVPTGGGRALKLKLWGLTTDLPSHIFFLSWEPCGVILQ